MSHPTDAVLIAYARGQAALHAQESVAAHLEACLDCQGRLDELLRLWELLDTWTVLGPSAGMLDRVNRVLDDEATTPFYRDRRFLVRAAAVIVLAAGIGHVTARALQPSPPGPGPVEETAVAEALHLGALDAEDRGLLAMVDDAGDLSIEGAAQ